MSVRHPLDLSTEAALKAQEILLGFLPRRSFSIAKAEPQTRTRLYEAVESALNELHSSALTRGERAALDLANDTVYEARRESKQ